MTQTELIRLGIIGGLNGSFGVTEDGFLSASRIESVPNLVYIPSEFDGKKILGIDERGFLDCPDLAIVSIEEGIEEIRTGAFENCVRLAVVKLPKSLLFLGDYAFSSCPKLVMITIPDNVGSIEDATFMGCVSLRKVITPKNLRKIGPNAFRGCSVLEAVKIGDTVESIGEYAFLGCRSLIRLEIPKSVDHIGSKAFFGCSGLRNIFYGGTCSQWRRIAGSNAEAGIPEGCIVRCSNGNVGV